MVNITMLVANRPRLTKQALDSIGDLSDATVTIRDAGMNKETLRVCEEWLDNNPGDHTHLMRMISPCGTGPARNQVVQSSEFSCGRGDYLYLSDDDVFWTASDWMKVMTSAYAEARIDGFRVLACYNHPFNRPCAPRINLSTHWDVNEVYAVATQSMLMDWATWDEFGPFCQTPAGKVCQSEDVDFCNRIRAAGYKVGVISPALLVNTGITNSFGEKIVGWEMVKKECPDGVICE